MHYAELGRVFDSFDIVMVQLLSDNVRFYTNNTERSSDYSIW